MIAGMSILIVPPEGDPSGDEFAKMFSPFHSSPVLREMMEERKKREAEMLKPLEFGYIKQKRVRLWARVYVNPRKRPFSKKETKPYYQGFWVEDATISGALRVTRANLEEFPAVINLYISNMPSDKSIAVASAPDRESWGLLACPKREVVPKPEPPKTLKLVVSAAFGVGVMVLLSLYWPRELFRFSWLLSLVGIGFFFVWRAFGDSLAVGRILNFFRPGRRVNILEDWCPKVEDFTR